MIRSVALLGMIVLISACSSSAPRAELKTYRIGYMICNSEQETLERFAPLSAWLARELGVCFETVAIDTVNFTREVENLDFVHTNSLLYIILHRLHGVDVLAAELKGPQGYRSQGVIVTLAKSSIDDVRDLKGKSMLFGPMLAPTGFMSQIDMLLAGGIDPESDLAFYTIPPGSFKHEKVLYGVMFEKYDAGALPLADIEEMALEGRINIEDFKVIATGPAIPYCNFGVTQKIDEHLAARFREALLSLSEDDTVEIDGETVMVLGRARVDGYAEINDADFDVVRDMAKRTNMPPYQKF